VRFGFCARSVVRIRPLARPQGLDVVKKYMCLICGFVYSEADGIPDEGIAPGTKWEDIPISWMCPDCGSGKEDFEMIEV
jgi:rubredoxin